ncbi:hypothetical protein [Fluviicoccus keumensis]|uniref:hypothetical protein n=1 Tax=Fluviicoccus keumensis TaxID=1435465 RepID=UPI00102BC448|nr:hypothetical protein [Fluviicoccus keumensis]
MTFIVRIEGDNDADYMRKIRLRGPLRLRRPAYIVEDLSLGVLVVPMGGKGRLPATTDEPPDYYSIYYGSGDPALCGLRRESSEKADDGSQILIYRVEFYLPCGNSVDFEVFSGAVLAYLRSIDDRLGYATRISGVRIVQ